MVFFIVIVLFFAVIAYLVGRGTKLTALKRAERALENHPNPDPDAFVNTRTGEIIEPGMREYDRALRKSRVRFE